MSKNVAIIVHGGAWAIPDKLVKDSLLGVENAVKIGWEILKSKGTSLDAVERAVNLMEENPVFDAGRGSALNEIGEIEMDAIIVDGLTLNFGSIAGARNIIHAVSLARKVMEKTDHAMMIGEGVSVFAKQINFPFVSKEELITKNALEEWHEYQKFQGVVKNLYNRDTVGAVAIDFQGNIASATSTGGITGKKLGRVGDSPLIGCGAIADNRIGGVSTTGHGEAIMKVMLSKRVLEFLEDGLEPTKAAQQGLFEMKEKVGGKGGVIVINSLGEIGLSFTSKRMVWAWMKNDRIDSGIEK